MPEIQTGKPKRDVIDMIADMILKFSERLVDLIAKFILKKKGEYLARKQTQMPTPQPVSPTIVTPNPQISGMPTAQQAAQQFAAANIPMPVVSQTPITAYPAQTNIQLPLQTSTLPVTPSFPLTQVISAQTQSNAQNLPIENASPTNQPVNAIKTQPVQ